MWCKLCKPLSVVIGVETLFISLHSLKWLDGLCNSDYRGNSEQWTFDTVILGIANVTWLVTWLGVTGWERLR